MPFVGTPAVKVSAATAQVAMPPFKVAGLAPVQVKPATVLVNVTIPVGVPLPGAVGVTWAKNVRGWPETAGLDDGVTTTLVASVFPGVTTASAVSALAPKLASPE
jgi:hypothetical protein